ncbi:STAS domain-containing protein [Bacillus salitolerans]|uniref:Anti-sigma factor antagonist n=1 Tax=Bacillus salitolerans TaxID=1437434 RepID=A0ABW4LRU2_9BACI
MLKYSLLEQEDGVRVDLEGDLDIETTEIIEEELTPSLLTYRSVVFNFERVPFVDSSGIGLLLKTIQLLTDQNIKVTITNVNEDVAMVFDILQISDIVGEDVFV